MLLTIKEIVRKSDVSFDIELPMLAVVGSQSTGTPLLTQEKAPSFKPSSENNFYPKEKE